MLTTVDVPMWNIAHKIHGSGLYIDNSVLMVWNTTFSQPLAIDRITLPWKNSVPVSFKNNFTKYNIMVSQNYMASFSTPTSMKYNILPAWNTTSHLPTTSHQPEIQLHPTPVSLKYIETLVQPLIQQPNTSLTYRITRLEYHVVI